MACTIEFSGLSQKNLRELDRKAAGRILRFLHERVAMSDDPRSLGEPLRGPVLGRYWKYRIGDYRVIADIEDQVVRILVVRIGNRRDVYKR